MASPTLASLQAYAKTHLGYDGVSKHDFARALSELYAVHGMTLPVNGRNGVDIDRVLAEPALQNMMDAWAEPTKRAALEPRRHLIRDIQEGLGVKAGEFVKSDQQTYDNIPGHNTLTKLSFYYAERGQGIPLNGTYQIDWDKVHHDIAGQTKQAEVTKTAPVKTETVAPNAATPEPKVVITDPNVTLAKETQSETDYFKKLDPKSYTPVQKTLNGVDITPPQAKISPASPATETGSVIPPLTTEKTVELKGGTNPLWDLSNTLNTFGVKTDSPAPVAAVETTTTSSRSFANIEPVKPVTESAITSPQATAEGKATAATSQAPDRTISPSINDATSPSGEHVQDPTITTTRTKLHDVQAIAPQPKPPGLTISQTMKDAVNHLDERVHVPEIQKQGPLKRFAGKVDHAVDGMLDGAANITEKLFHSKKNAEKKNSLEQGTATETKAASNHENQNESISLEGRNKFGLRRFVFGEKRFPIVNKTDAQGNDVQVRWNSVGQHEVKHKETLAGQIIQDVAIRAENTAIRVVTTPVRLVENLFDLNGDGKKSPKNFPRERGDILSSKHEAEYCVSAEENLQDRITNPGPIEHIQKAFGKLKIEDTQKIDAPVNAGGGLQKAIDTVKKVTGQSH